VIRVELYETARRLAGVAQVDVEARTLGEALREVARRHPALLGPVIDGDRPARLWRASVGGRAFVEDPGTPLADGDAVILVSALAGG
jgi:molybdopterin converting factor small subunit